MATILLITPPFTQLNTPYPGTAYLKGFLNTKNIATTQMDLGIEVILQLFSRTGLQNIFEISVSKIHDKTTITSENSHRIWALQEEYCKTIDAVIQFLQGKNPTLAIQICHDNFLPEASRFQNIDDLQDIFGSMGMQDKAKHLATLYLEDISDFIVEIVDSNFGFSRYAEKLGRSANSFDALHNALQQTNSHIDEITLRLLEQKIIAVNPALIGFSVPFPGNLYSAFKCAQFIKANFPNIKITMGGGFPNTELRSLSDVRVFDYFDFITLDDGELPVELVHNICVSETNTNSSEHEYKRTFIVENDQVVYKNNTAKRDYKQSEVGTPDYSDLLLDNYISVIEIANPMNRMWSDGRWNKLTMAHGCYWGKCTFCDISLDYIGLYEPIAASIIVDRMEELCLKTGQSGFHFVDEAAPPALMREVALEILRRKLVVTWWTNIRFEKSFTFDLCQLLKASGCIAVSGGLEVASDRLLKLIDKGVTVEQVAVVTDNFTKVGIMVHAYLMYGYPTQTVQETIDSIEMVRQMFQMNVLQSAFWHQFAMTVHSPVGMHPEKFNVTAQPSKELLVKGKVFASNDVNFIDATGIDHDKFSFGLKKSLYNYMHGVGLEFDLQKWFDFKIPRTKIHPNYIEDALSKQDFNAIKPTSKIIWIGHQPSTQVVTKSKKGNSWQLLQFTFHSNKETITIQTDHLHGQWLLTILEKISIKNPKTMTFGILKLSFETEFEDIELFWYSKPIKTLRKIGLLVL